jgi:hypothetical protein
VLQPGYLRGQPGDRANGQDENPELDTHPVGRRGHRRCGDDALHSGRAIAKENVRHRHCVQAELFGPLGDGDEAWHPMDVAVAAHRQRDANLHN